MWWESGVDTFDAYQRLGVEPDPRAYSNVGEVLRFLGLRSVRLLTNNQRKLDGLEGAGLQVERIPLLVEPTEDSRPYLETKRVKFGHLL